uniref:small monomeric GTPase n=1 Tax=Moschus moschiferus TaxID=68415 RepID=A0A8C6CWN5_MOSMO
MGTQGSPVKSYDYLLKFLLVGDSDVGKGEILESLQDGAAESPYAYSNGIDYKTTTILLDGRRVKLELWDTSGQGRFCTIFRSYSRGAQVPLRSFWSAAPCCRQACGGQPLAGLPAVARLHRGAGKGAAVDPLSLAVPPGAAAPRRSEPAAHRLAGTSTDTRCRCRPQPRAVGEREHPGVSRGPVSGGL